MAAVYQIPDISNVTSLETMLSFLYWLEYDPHLSHAHPPAFDPAAVLLPNITGGKCFTVDIAEHFLTSPFYENQRYLNRKFKNIFFKELDYLRGTNAFTITFESSIDFQRIRGTIFRYGKKNIYACSVEGSMSTYVKWMMGFRAKILSKQGYNSMSMYFKAVTENVLIIERQLTDDIKQEPLSFENVDYKKDYFVLNAHQGIVWTQDEINKHTFVEFENMFSLVQSRPKDLKDPLKNVPVLSMDRIQFSLPSITREDVLKKRKLEDDRRAEQNNKLPRTYSSAINGGKGYHRVPGTEPYSKHSCEKD